MSKSSAEFARVVTALQAGGFTLALAESCTGGLVSAGLARRPGVSSVFLGSVVAYSNDIKEHLLGVSAADLAREGAVSEIVALQMARGVRAKMQSSFSVSITGIAGPSGGSAEKPVGTVCFAIVGPGIESTERKWFAGDRESVQDQAVVYVLEMLLANVK